MGSHAPDPGSAHDAAIGLLTRHDEGLVWAEADSSLTRRRQTIEDLDRHFELPSVPDLPFQMELSNAALCWHSGHAICI